MSEYDRKRYWENREIQLARASEWRRANPEKMRAWRKRNKHKASALARRRKFGISAVDFQAMLDAQGGQCAICRTDKPGGVGGWHLDHDHRFPSTDPRGHRGVLCCKCNRALGYFRDDPATLRAAVDHVEDHTYRTRAAPAPMVSAG